MLDLLQIYLLLQPIGTNHVEHTILLNLAGPEAIECELFFVYAQEVRVQLKRQVLLRWLNPRH